jgi:hypothetical protein
MARTAEGQTSVAQEIKNLMLREQQRREARQIKHALNAPTRRALSSIEVYRSGQWVELETRQDIESALLHELEAHFNQAASTPFCCEPLLSSIGPLGNSAAARSVLAGNFSTPRCTDHWAVQLLPYLKQTIPTTEPRPITTEKHIAGWKRVREKTLAGPSGITIPHMKAHGFSKILSDIDTTMANLPYLHGFSPQRWKKGLDVMLEKKPGVHHFGQFCCTRQTSTKTIKDWVGKCCIERNNIKQWPQNNTEVEKSFQRSINH